MLMEITAIEQIPKKDAGLIFVYEGKLYYKSLKGTKLAKKELPELLYNWQEIGISPESILDLIISEVEENIK